jgi:hypothetical protein
MVIENLKPAKEWLPLGLATTYVLGFVIVGFHLAGYGASTLDLIKAQYLAAGFWFCLIFVAYFAALWGIRSLLARLARGTRRPGFQQSDGARGLLNTLLANAFLIGTGIVFVYSIQPTVRGFSGDNLPGRSVLGASRCFHGVSRRGNSTSTVARKTDRGPTRLIEYLGHDVGSDDDSCNLYFPTRFIYVFNHSLQDHSVFLGRRTATTSRLLARRKQWERGCLLGTGRHYRIQRFV